MKQTARLLLAITRDANARHMPVPGDLFEIIQKHLELAFHETLTNQDSMKIGELLKADMREEFAFHPHFPEINAKLDMFPKLEE